MARNTQSSIPADDDFWDDAVEVDTEFGDKFKFGKGKDEITTFTGRFLRTKQVPNPDDGELMHAAEFLDNEGEKVYCWLPSTLRNAFDNVNNGDYVRIELTGEEPTDKGNPMLLFSVKVKKGSPVNL